MLQNILLTGRGIRRDPGAMSDAIIILILTLKWVSKSIELLQFTFILLNNLGLNLPIVSY